MSAGGKAEEAHANQSLLALQIGDKYRVTTPVNWNKGDDVIVHPSVSTEEAKTLFPAHTVHKVRHHSLYVLQMTLGYSLRDFVSHT